MTVNSNSALSPASLIAQAFRCDEVASSKATTGVQTMAAAILSHHESNLAARKASMKAISERGEAYNDFRASFLELKVDGVPVIQPRVTKKDDVKDDVRATANNRNMAQMTLLNKGFDLAFALDACGVSLASFVSGKDGGVFHVPVSALVSNDDDCLGALLNASKKGTRIPLDGKTYAYTHNDKFTNLRAYPARVLEIAGYKKPVKGASVAASSGAAGPVVVTNGASDTTTTGTATAAEIKADPATWSYSHLLTTAADLLLRASEIAKEGEAVAWSALDDKTRNALDGLLIFRDECMAVEATKIAKAA